MCPGCDLLVGRRRARLTAPETLVQHWARQPRLAFFLANDCWPGDAEQLKAALERGGRAELELHLRTLYYCLYLGNLEEYERTTRLPDYAPTALKEGLSVSCTFKALHGFDPSY